MSLFDALFVAHLIGDWILQNDWQAKNKSKSWWALISHVLIYHVLILGVLLYFVGSQPSVYIAVVLLAFSHLILDRQTTIIWLMQRFHNSGDGTTPERWLMVAFDQALHIVLLGITAFVLTR
jgi:hypothetical protein